MVLRIFRFGRLKGCHALFEEGAEGVFDLVELVAEWEANYWTEDWAEDSWHAGHDTGYVEEDVREAYVVADICFITAC